MYVLFAFLQYAGTDTYRGQWSVSFISTAAGCSSLTMDSVWRVNWTTTSNIFEILVGFLSFFFLSIWHNRFVWVFAWTVFFLLFRIKHRLIGWVKTALRHLVSGELIWHKVKYIVEYLTLIWQVKWHSIGFDWSGRTDGIE